MTGQDGAGLHLRVMKSTWGMTEPLPVALERIADARCGCPHDGGRIRDRFADTVGAP
jgi:hypothetical protein